MMFGKTTIVRVEHPGPDYVYIVFRGDSPVGGAPGQFVMVRGAFGTDPILPRAFSLVAAGDEGAILVKAVGKATRRLAAMRPGDTLMVLGPLGNTFTVPAEEITPLLIAGGVGVAPLMFMAETLAAGGRRPVFVYGGRSASDLLYQDRIGRVADLFLSTEDGTLGQKGRVTDLLPRLETDGRAFAAFTCGPEPMMKALFRALPKSIPLEVALEQAMACGMGTCKGCAVHDRDGNYRYVCSDGPVFDAEAIFGGER